MSNNDGDCSRCGASSFSLFSEAVIMSGVYIAHLCVDCRNDWDEYILPHPTRMAKDAVDVAMGMAFAQTCGDGVDRTDTLTRLREEDRAIDRALRDLATAWVADTITR